jgi:DNA-binding MarR family transcriptional regulator
MDINLFRNALESFQEIDSDMSLPTIMAFLFVAQREKCTQREVELELGLTNAGASRNVSYWTDRRFDRKPGVGFIDRTEDDYDRRYKVLRLTSKGQSFYDNLRGLSKHGKTSRK